MEFFKSVPRCSHCNSMVSLDGGETVIANMRFHRANQEHYYCDENCFYKAMEKASHCGKLEIEVVNTAPNRFVVLCKEVSVEVVG